MLVPLPIAQVQTPSGAVWYIAHARTHQGFVVQRCYQKASKQLRGDEGYVQAQLLPFLNPAAVQAAGLFSADILAWSAAHPGEVFAHSVYAPLCLRWGENAHGYRVEELSEQPLTAQQVPFTPHTCWQSGLTYYQLAISTLGEQHEPVLVARLRDLAGLERHEWEIGREGNWGGWYATDRAALEDTLTSLGRSFALAQPQQQYGVWIQLEPGDKQRQLVVAYDNNEQAWAHFCALPKPLDEFRCEFPRATFGCAVAWPGQEVEWDVIDGMYISRAYAEQVLSSSQPWTGRIMPVAYRPSLNEVEYGLLGPAPFLAKFLAGTVLSRPQQAAALGWLMRALQQREKNPALLSSSDISGVARLAGQQPGEVADQLSEELKRREDARQQMLTYKSKRLP